MAESEFTPSPWEVGKEVDSGGRLVYIPIRRGKLHISTTGVYGRKPDGTTAGRKYVDRFGDERYQPVITAEECRANARLIAAAPELFAACEAALAEMGHAYGCGADSEGACDCAYGICREAVRKAIEG